MAPASALLLAAALVSAASSDLKAYKACRHQAQAVRGGGCTWRSGSLFSANGYYSTRLAFRAGLPSSVVVHQPGVPQADEFVPAQATGLKRYPIETPSIDGVYLVCTLPSLRSPYDSDRKLDTACLAGTRQLRAGSFDWAFSDPAATVRKRERH